MDVVFNKTGTVVFKVNTPTTAATLGRVDSYATLLTTDGRYRKLDSKRALLYGELTFGGVFELITRFQDAIVNAIRPDLKIDIDGVRHTIQSWEKVDEKRFWLRFIIAKE